MVFLAILPDEKVTQRFIWLEHPLETQDLRPIIESLLSKIIIHAFIMQVF